MPHDGIRDLVLFKDFWVQLLCRIIVHPQHLSPGNDSGLRHVIGERFLDEAEKVAVGAMRHPGYCLADIEKLDTRKRDKALLHITWL